MKLLFSIDVAHKFETEWFYLLFYRLLLLKEDQISRETNFPWPLSMLVRLLLHLFEINLLTKAGQGMRQLQGKLLSFSIVLQGRKTFQTLCLVLINLYWKEMFGEFPAGNFCSGCVYRLLDISKHISNEDHHLMRSE